MFLLDEIREDINFCEEKEKEKNFLIKKVQKDLNKLYYSELYKL